MFKRKLFSLINQKQLYKQQVMKYSSKKHNTNFDYNLDWILNSYLTNKLTLTKGFLFINFSFFAYCWLRPTENGRYSAQSNVSMSAKNLTNRDYINIFSSQLGSRRLDDLIFDSAVLLTIGAKLEKIHGSPFIFKLSLFSLYLGLMSSFFWIKSPYAINDRYKLPDPRHRQLDSYYKDYEVDYKYMSQHSISMSLLYFYLFKYNRILVLPALAFDLYYWGVLYGNAALTGLAMGIIL